jgi:hypothetical protein
MEVFNGKQPLASADSTKCTSGNGDLKHHDVAKSKPSILGTISNMEAVIAVATMAAFSALPMTTLQSLCAIFCTETLQQGHELITLHFTSLVDLFPTGLMQFRALFCCWIAFSLLRFHRAQARFYAWFTESGIAPSKCRGFGYFGCRAFGIFPMPALTQFQFHATCILMALCLVAAASPFNSVLATRMFLGGALVMYVLYFSQLFCESRAGGHSTIIIPLVLIHLICASEGSHHLVAWSILLLKLHIACCYFSAGYGKIITSIYFGKFWGSGKAQQYMFFESMWSRPGGKVSRWLQEFAFRRLWLNAFMATFTLIFQLSVPLAVLDLRISWFFFLLSFKFHASVLITTNISFMPYWVPSLLIFLFPHGAAPFDGPLESAQFALSGAWQTNAIGFSCICVYLLAQAIVSLGVIDLIYGDILPLSCEPMFVLPRSINDQWPKLFVLTTANCREAGHLEPYVHCSFNPVSKIFPLDKEAMMNLPAKTLIFMTLNEIAPEVVDFLQKDVKPTPCFVWSNVAVDEATMKNYREIAEILNNVDEPAWSDAKKLDRLIDLQSQCAAAFQAACLKAPESSGFNSVEPTPLEKAL